ncbi:MAG TPA: LuxR C-terminal-related transcriptional regulator [Symbiobacteriaceae bacterium]|nr:LuxR C-terminal-related transcriptional regulator [Symbiobacteriaceae bacterium]
MPNPVAFQWPQRMLQLSKSLAQADTEREQATALIAAFDMGPAATLSVIVPESGGISMRVAASEGPGGCLVRNHGPVAEFPLAGWCMRAHEPVVISSPATDYRTRWIHERMPDASLVMSFPIRAASRVWGVVKVVIAGPSDEARAAFDSLKSVAELAGFGLTQVAKRKSTQQQVRHLMAVNDIATRVAASDDASATLSLIVDVVTGIFELDVCVMMLRGGDGICRTEAARGLTLPELHDFGAGSPHLSLGPLPAANSHYVTTVPIPGPEGPVGYLLLSRTSRLLTEQELTLISSWASLTGVVLKIRSLVAESEAAWLSGLSAGLSPCTHYMRPTTTPDCVNIAVAVAGRMGLKPSEVAYVRAVATLNRLPDLPQEPDAFDLPTYYGNLLETVRSVTEHWDGSGTPEGRAGVDIPLAARIVAASAFCAKSLITPGASPDSATAPLRAAAGTRFDPEVVTVLNRVAEEWLSEPNGFLPDDQMSIVGMTHGRRSTDSAARSRSLDLLTAREREIISLLALGLSNREIAARLYLSEATVKTHVSRIFRKLEVPDRTNAALFFTNLMGDGREAST